MFKNAVIKFQAFFIAFVLLLSTTSFAVEKHFCAEILVDFSFRLDTQSCCPEPDPEEQINFENSCCQDSIEVFSGQKQLKQDQSDWDIQVPKASILSFTSINSALSLIQEQRLHLLVWSKTPPFCNTPLYLRNEQWLI
ncbi:hypothetical protein ACFSQ0_12375 [Mesonia sediminis]|uniref:Uncharacterized protein n=1 Tax=Mesonia sediminis TaxID=1703946 RepID=A0ABW5SHY4_9FLAO